MSFITFNNLSRFEQGIKNILSQVLGGLSSTVGNSTLNTAAQNLTGAINEHEVDIGDLSSLITTEKSNLVGAVNETESSISSLYSSVNEMRLHPMKYAEIEIDSEGNGPPTATLSLKMTVDATQFYKPLTYTFYRHKLPGSPPYTPPSPSGAIYEQAQTGTNNVYEGTMYDRWIFGKITDVSGRSVVSDYYLLPADES